jgi:hypothetical protein
MSTETSPFTPPASPDPDQWDSHQPDTRYFTPQPRALVPSIASALEDHAQHYQGPPSKSTHGQSNPRSTRGRVLILCFDGTGQGIGKVSALVFSLVLRLTFPQKVGKCDLFANFHSSVRLEFECRPVLLRSQEGQRRKSPSLVLPGLSTDIPRQVTNPIISRVSARTTRKCSSRTL